MKTPLISANETRFSELSTDSDDLKARQLNHKSQRTLASSKITKDDQSREKRTRRSTKYNGANSSRKRSNHGLQGNEIHRGLTITDREDEIHSVDPSYVSPRNTKMTKKPSNDRKYHKGVGTKVQAMPLEQSKMRVEKHRLTVCEHRIIVNQMKLCERKEKTEVYLIDINSGEYKEILVKYIILHTRSIDEIAYTTETTEGPDGDIIDFQVITDLEESEVKEFEQYWKEFWIPKVTEEEIETAKSVSQLEINSDKLTIDDMKEEKVEVEAFENISSHSDSNSSNVLQLDEDQKYENSVSVIDNNTHLKAIITAFVKDYPFEVFCAGTFAFVLALLVSYLYINLLIAHCSNENDYPLCQWISCIIECMEDANSADL